jgi:hypothetical protein
MVPKSNEVKNDNLLITSCSVTGTIVSFLINYDLVYLF